MNEQDLVSVDQVFSAIYNDLKRAAYGMKRSDGSITLNPTALVHEAYLRVAGGADFSPDSQEHVRRTALRAMRNVLIDAARKRKAGKHGGGRRPESLNDEMPVLDRAASFEELVQIGLALEALEKDAPELVRLIEDSMFWGMSRQEMAKRAGVSERTIATRLKAARNWLKVELFRSHRDDVR